MKKFLFALPALAILASATLFSGCELPEGMSKEEAKQVASEFINGTLMKGQEAQAEVKSVEEAGEMYKLKVAVNGQEVDSYISADGKMFFPQVLDIETVKGAVAEQAAATEAAAAPMEKSDKPVVELFVMSHCPFGTQIEKGMIPVVEALGDSVDFQLKFVDYAMHGKKELDEQLNQSCIKKEQPELLLGYLKCFLTDGEGSACLEEVGVDTEGLASCVAAMDEEYKVTELFNDQSTWNAGRFPLFNLDKEAVTKYGVKGSPTLVINGKVSGSARDSQSLMNSICEAFNEKPEACDAEMDSASPSAGFGWEVGAAGTEAQCG